MIWTKQLYNNFTILFDALSPSQHLFTHAGIFPQLNQY